MCWAVNQLFSCQIKAGSAVFGPFCGDRSPGVIQTDSNVAVVVFHSDGSGENLGWRLGYTAAGESVSRCCKQTHSWEL